MLQFEMAKERAPPGVENGNRVFLPLTAEKGRFLSRAHVCYCLRCSKDCFYHRQVFFSETDACMDSRRHHKSCCAEWCRNSARHAGIKFFRIPADER